MGSGTVRSFSINLNEQGINVNKSKEESMQYLTHIECRRFIAEGAVSNDNRRTKEGIEYPSLYASQNPIVL